MVALDLTALLAVGVMAVQAMMATEVSLLTGALVVGLLAFLGTVAFARYIEKRAGR